MLRTYRAVLSRPGAWAFTIAGLVARLPSAMVGLGIILSTSAVTGSYALAGALAAAQTLGFALASPLWSRIADRHGQRVVILPALSLRSLALLSFAYGIVNGWVPLVLGVLCLVGGMCQVSAGSLVRSRWVALLGGSPSLRTAFALEGILDETVFIVGPPLVTLLSLGEHPSLGVVAAVGIEIAGMLSLWSQRRTTPLPHPDAVSGRRGRLWTPASTGVILAAVFIGGVFGSVDLAIVAFSRAQGSTSLAGAVLAVYAFGSLAGGLFIGALKSRFSLTRQYVAASIILTLTLLPLPFVGSVGVLAVFVALAGLAVAPLLISGASLIERLVAPDRLTEGLTWLLSALLVGVAASGSVSGFVIDTYGATAGFLVGAACGAVTMGVALACRRVIRSGEATRTG